MSAAAVFWPPTNTSLPSVCPTIEKVSADPDLTATTFARYLEGYIREQGWQTYGEVVVRFESVTELAHRPVPRPRSGQPGRRAPPTRQRPPRPPTDHAYTAEPGVPPMTDNPSHRGGQGQGRPGDEYYDDALRPADERSPAADPPDPGRSGTRRAGRLPPQPGYPPAPATPTKAAIPSRVDIRRRAATPPSAATARRLATPAGRLPRPGRLPGHRADTRPAATAVRPAATAPVVQGGAYRPPGSRLRLRQATGRHRRARTTTAATTQAATRLPPGGDAGRRAATRRRPGGYPEQRRLSRRLPDRAATPSRAATRTNGYSRAARATASRTEYAQPDYGRYAGSAAAAQPADTPIRGYARPAQPTPALTTASRPGRLRRLRPRRLRLRRRHGHPAARRRQRPHLPAARGRQHRRPRPGRPVPVARHRRLPPAPGDPLGRAGRAAVRPQLHERHHRQQRAGSGVAVGRWRRHPARPLRDHRSHSLRRSRAQTACGAVASPRVDRRPSIVTLPMVLEVSRSAEECGARTERTPDAGISTAADARRIS